MPIPRGFLRPPVFQVTKKVTFPGFGIPRYRSCDGPPHRGKGRGADFLDGMRFAQDNHMVDALASDRSDQPFGKAVLPKHAALTR